MVDDSATLLEIRDLLREILVEMRTERPAAPAKRSRRKPAPVIELTPLDQERAVRILDKLGLR